MPMATDHFHPPSRRRFLLGGGSLLALLSAALVWRQGHGENGMPQETGLLPAAVSPERDLKSPLAVVGTVEAGDVVSIAAPFDASVKEKYFSFDTLVTQGQWLLSLDTTELQARLGEARIALLKAEKNRHDLDTWDKGSEMARASRNLLAAQQQLEQAQRKLKESEALYKKGIIPRLEYESVAEQYNGQLAQVAAASDDLGAVRDKAAPSQREIAHIEYEQAAAKYRDLKAAQALGKISAPQAGIVARISSSAGAAQPTLDVGSRVTKGQPLFTIAATDQLRASAKIDEIDIADVAPGLPVEISLEGHDMPPIAGHILAVAAQGSQTAGMARSASFEIRIELAPLSEQQRRLVRVGMSCNIHISRSGESATAR